MSEKLKKKRELGSALADTINAEEKSVNDRFKRADAVFQQKESADRPSVNEKSSGSATEAISQERVGKAIQTKNKPEKVVRDTFTMPPHDYQRIAEIQKEGLQSAIQVNKSEVIRAGLIVLQELSSQKRLQVLESVEKIKPGRPPR